ncbi:MAG: FG-GAP-like repeat-containing protein [Candidatus Zipacnadales bacterium]
METACLYTLLVTCLASRAFTQTEPLWCFGFESTDGLTTGWGTTSDKIMITLNTEGRYVSEGQASVRLSAVSRAEAEGNHYVSLIVPLPAVDLADRMITFDAWTSLPEATQALYVRAYDADGKVIVSWNNWGAPLSSGRTHHFELQPEVSLGGFAWEADKITASGTIAQRIEFIMGTHEKGTEFDIFLDNLCIVPARYRAFNDLTEPAPRRPFTVLSEAGKPAALIIRPSDITYDTPVRMLVDGIREVSGAELEVQTDKHARADLAAFITEMAQTNVILLGNIHNNWAMLPVYSHSACYADGIFPGEGGYEVRTVHDPWGTGKNVVVIGGTDVEGVEEGVRVFLSRLEGGADLRLPPIVEVKLTGEAERRWGKWFTAELGDPYLEKVRIEAQKRIETGAHTGLAAQAAAIGDEYALTGRDDYARAFVWVICRWKEHHDTAPDTYGGPWGMDADFMLYRLIPQWDLVEESAALTDDDRLAVLRILFEFINEACVPKAQSVMGNERVRHNHQTFPALGLFYAGEYFSRHYQLAEAVRWTEIADECFTMQAKAFKPHEDCNGYQWLTLGHLTQYALAKPDFTYFENGNARLAAELAILSMDNLGYQVTYGDTGAYTGWWSELPLLWTAAWYYDDPGFRWAALRKREVSGRFGLSWFELEGDGTPPTHLLGTKHFPVDPYYYATWGGADALPLRAAVDKIALREGFDPQDAYLLLDGLSNGSHGHYDGNSISRWTEHGRIWLADADYIKSLPKYHNGVLILKDGSSQTIPDFCELEHIADLPSSGLSITTLRNYAGVDWRRHLLWLKGICTIVADQMIAREEGSYSFRPIWQTIGEIEPTEGGVIVTQAGQHAAIVSPPSARCLLTDDPESGANWSAYKWAPEPTVRRLQQVYNADLRPGESATYFTVLYASGETIPALKVNCPAEGFVYTEVGEHKLLAGAIPPDGELHVLDLALQADAFVATAETLAIFGLRRAIYQGQQVSVDSPVDLEIDLRQMQLTVEAKEPTIAHVPFLGDVPLPAGRSRQTLPPGAEMAGQLTEELLAQVAALPSLPATSTTMPEDIPQLRSVFTYSKRLPSYLLTANRGAFEAVNVGATVSCDPAPLERNIFASEGQPNIIENMLDGDLTSAAGSVMWNIGETVTLKVHFPQNYTIHRVIVKAWHATSSSKGRIFQIRSIALEGSSDGFATDTRRLANIVDTESHPNWGGDPRMPYEYVLPVADQQASDLRLTITPRRGTEVEVDASMEQRPDAAAIYLAELEVWGTREDLGASDFANELPCHTFSALTAGDLNADGVDEIVAGNTDGKVYVFKADGSLLWTAEAGAVVNTVAVVDLGGRLAVVAGAMGGIVKAWQPDGTNLWTWQAPYYKQAPHVRTVFGANFGEGKLAIIAGCDNWRYYALRADGTELWHYESVHGSTVGAPGDVDGDGIDEVALGTEYYWWYLVNARGEKIWRYWTRTGPTANACAIGDLNGDSKREVLFGGADSNLHVISPDGKLLWQLNTGDEVTALACADIDGDGVEEAVLSSLSFNVYAVKGNGTVLWRRDVGTPVLDLCFSGDRVCALTADGRVCCLEGANGEWRGVQELGARGLRIIATHNEALRLVTSTGDGTLHGLTW